MFKAWFTRSLVTRQAWKVSTLLLQFISPAHIPRRSLAYIVPAVMLAPARVDAQGSRGRTLFTGIQVQNVSDTQSVSVHLSYYDAKVNRQGLVVYGANLDGGERAIVAAWPQPGGGFAQTTVADSGPGSAYTHLGEFSLDNHNRVAFTGTDSVSNEGVWQASITISADQPIVGVINEVVNAGTSTLSTFKDIRSGVGTASSLPHVSFMGLDSAAPDPFLFNLYKATFDTMTSQYAVQNVDTASTTDITVTFSYGTNDRGDFAIQGVQELPEPPFSQEAIGLVNPDNPSRDVVLAITGDNLGGHTITGFTDVANVSSNASSIVAIVNHDAAPGARAAVAYNGFDDGGTKFYLPTILRNSFTSDLELIQNVSQDPDNRVAAWKATRDGGGDVLECGSTDPTLSQPVLEIARTGLTLSGAGLTSAVASLSLGSEAFSGGGRDEIAFIATLEDNTAVVALATLEADTESQPSALPGPVPVGAEQQVNTTTSDDQRDPAVSMADDGSFVVTWVSQSPTSSLIQFQRYDASGDPQGPQTSVTGTTGTNILSDPDIAIHPGTGGFGLTWRITTATSETTLLRFYDSDGAPVTATATIVGGSPGTTSSPTIDVNENMYTVAVKTTSGPEGFVLARRFDLSGAPMGSLFSLNVTEPAPDTRPSITIDGSDVATVTWIDAAGQGVKRQFDASGTVLGTSETPISDELLAGSPKIAANDSGDLATTYVISSTMHTLPASNNHLVRFFDSNCNPTTGDVPINSTAADASGDSSVALDDQGTAAGVWVGAGEADIRANWISPDDIIFTAEHALTDSQPGKRGQPDIAMNGGGQAAVVYRTDDQDGDAGGIYVLRVDEQRQILGGELPVNLTTVDDQNAPTVATGDTGDLVVTQIHNTTTASTVVYQRLDADGTPLSPEITVNTTTGTNSNPHVARNAAGLSNVVWQNNETDVWSMYYDESDAGIGSSFLVNQTGTGKESRPRVVMDSAGRIYVVWDRADSPEIVFRKFDTSGSPLTGEIAVNTMSDGSQSDPAIALNEQALYLPIIFKGNSIHGRIFDLAGNPITTEFQVNTITTGDQIQPAVAALPGGFVVAFTSTHQDGDILRRYYDHAGMPLGPEVQVNTFAPNLQHEPIIAADAGGSHIVAWTSLGQDGSVSGVYGQWFNPDGLPQGQEFRLNSTTLGAQHQPVVAMLPTGRIAAIWTSADQDGDGDGVFGRMFHPAPGDLDNDGVPNGVDACPNTIPGAPVDAEGCPPVIPGDFDRDGDVDDDDVEAFRACAAGPAIPLEPGCEDKDFEEDGNVDQTDFATLQRCISGKNLLGDPDCAD